MDEGIDYPNWITREVFAHFGLAMYCGQVLEKDIVNLIVCLKFDKKQEKTLKEWDRLTEIIHKLTLGQLKNEINKEASISNDFKKILIELVEIRNFLAHQFFWDHAGKFCLLEGKTELISELDEYRDKFKEGQVYINKRIRVIFKDRGFTDKWVDDRMKKEMETIIQEERNRD